MNQHSMILQVETINAIEHIAANMDTVLQRAGTLSVDWALLFSLNLSLTF